MARLFTSGFELNSVTDGVEFSTNNAPVSIVTTAPRSGSYHGRVNAGNGFWRQLIFTSNKATIGYIGIAVRIHSAVNASTQLIRWSTTGNISVGNITLKTDNTLVLLGSNGAQIGSASAALVADTWYYIELKNDASTNPGTLEARLNASVFATGANSNQGQWARALIGCVTGTQTTNDIYFDDWKVNDNSGASQTGYPGNGNVLLTSPNGAGESTQWTKTGGATNWQSVNEIPPDDATTFVSEALLNNVDLYTVASLGLHSYDTINLVQVGCRFSNDVADATTSFQFEIEKVNGGTKLQSASIVPNSTLWRTNTIAAPDTYALTAYNDPDGAAWVGGSGGTLDSMRIGMIAGLVGVNKIQVTAIWAYVDYTPGVAPSAGIEAFQPISQPTNHYRPDIVSV